MKKYFSTLLPPPNLTGTLHLGHMWNAILQDVLIKFYQSKNIQTYWGFGLDHAGLSLQIKVESELKKQGIKKSSLSEKEFWNKLWKWKEKHEAIILSQYKNLDLSLPIGEKNFTLDENSKKVVIWAFKKLYKEGFIYRAERLVNWDISMKTAISDIEVIYKKEEVNMYKLKYFFVDDESKFLEVATTRVETIFGDVALFVHPEDDKYKDFVGKQVYVPYINRKIYIISDSYIDREFGTGVMKCTPAHDFHDWKLGKKYKLPVLKAFDENGIMTKNSVQFKGISKDDCKKKLIEELKEKGILSIEKYITNVSYSERSQKKIEPTLSKQWFLKSSVLAEKALDYLKKNEFKISFFPEKAKDWMYQNLKNTEDWCISRQLLWGIKIPVWINKKTDKYLLNEPEDFENWNKSEDVLDTWFSSSLWPLIVFKQIDEVFNSDFSLVKKFFPISLLISGKDILFFWISRMIFFSVYFLDTIPFKNIYLHGLIVDSKNRKMSKSLNNGILPHELIEKFGNDSSRFFFLSNTHFDKNISFAWEKPEYAKKFLHKLDNVFNFLSFHKSFLKNKYFDVSKMSWYEKWIFKKFLKFKKEIENDFLSFKFSPLSKKIVEFLWDDFCNTYIEFFKIAKKEKLTENNISFVFFLWSEILKILYPIFPNFSTEKYLEIYEKKISFKKTKIISIPSDSLDYNWFFKYINVVRNIYTELKIKKNSEMIVDIVVPKSFKNFFIEKYSDLFSFFSLVNQSVGKVKEEKQKNKVICVLIDDFLFEISSDNETMRNYFNQIEKIKTTKRKEVERAINFLKNENFCKKAPEFLIKQEQDKLEKYKKELEFYENL